MGQDLWIAARFRDDTVLARCDASGALKADDRGFVDFRYKPDGKVYRSRPDSFEVVADATAGTLAAAGGSAAAKTAARAAKATTGRGAASGVRLVSMGQRRTGDGVIELWTDGACSGNPGPAGAGVHYAAGGEVREVSEYLGQGTNNIAELTAILRALEMVDDPTAPVDVMSDSDYSIKVVSGVYKAKKNQELIATIQRALAPFTDLQLVKVPGHAGVEGNERADELARLAITRRANWRGP